MPVPWTGIRIWAAYAGVSFFLFFIDVSDGEEQDRRYYYYRYYRSCIHRAASFHIFQISTMRGESLRRAPCLVKMPQYKGFMLLPLRLLKPYGVHTAHRSAISPFC